MGTWEGNKYIDPKVEDLLGKTCTKVEHIPNGYDGFDEVRFTLEDGSQYRLCYHSDCCATVNLEETIGELTDLEGSPLTMAEEVSNYAGPELDYESYTWTFYKFATVKGYVTLRFLGTSNGYYSESVSFDKISTESVH